MALRFQTRLSLAMSLLIAVAISAMAILTLWAGISLIVDHYNAMGVTVTKLATRNIEYGAALPDRVMERVGEQMVVSALLISELVAVAEGKAGMTPEEVSAMLRGVRDRSADVRGYPLVDDMWVTDESGKEYIGANEVTGFQFSPDPAKSPQSHIFYSLLTPGTKPIIQEFQPRDEDGKTFEYVGVGGVDKPRIIQVGAGERLLQGIQTEFSVQNVVDRFFPDLDATRMMVVDRKGAVIAAAGRSGLSQEMLQDPEVRDFCKGFLAQNTNPFLARAFGREFGVATRLKGAGDAPPMALFIQHRTEEGFQLVRDTFFYLLGLTVVTIGVAVVLIMVLSNGFSRPIRQLAEGARQFGEGNLAYRIRLDSRDEMQSLAQAFNSMADSLQERMCELETATKHRERLESELAIAAEMQRALLPEFPPEIAGLDLSGWSQPAREVGGDFYDYFAVGPGRIRVVIGDATGKGLSAAMLTSECWSTLRALAADVTSLADLLARTNVAMCDAVGVSGRFVTLFAMEVDTGRGILRYAQGGHNPPVLLGIAPERRLLLSCPVGLPLGVDRHCEFREHEVPLLPGDTIVLYSDGITEARGSNDLLYGDKRLHEELRRLCGLSATDVLARIRSDVETHLGGLDLTDDITLVTVCYSGAGT
ncbi:MAG: SpoIIE family protein phosphatase [Candidatus Hydrogenedentes bacterium]|nr:SpoIIE family protein phosphatase [Candidatus Hydrogenedentota bacterium]